MAVVTGFLPPSPMTPTEHLPTGDESVSKRPKLKPGQYALDTFFNVYCGNHKERKAIIRLHGDLKLEYKEDEGLSQWDQMEPCELAGCSLRCVIADNDVPGLFCTELLQQALAQGAEVTNRLPCGHRVTQECSTCSESSLSESIVASDDGTATAVDPQKPPNSDGDSAVTEISGSANSTDSGKDTSNEETRGPGAEARDEETANKDPTLVDGVPFRRFGALSPEDASAEKQQNELIAEPEQETSGSSQVSLNTKEETTPTEEAKQGCTDSMKSESEFNRVSESACHPITYEEAPAPEKTKLTKEAKARRATTLKQQREERKQAHEEEIQDVMEEISHQREVLRSRRDQKEQKQKLRDLQKKLERLCQKELDDSDYATTEDEEETDDSKQTSSRSSSPSGKEKGDCSEEMDGELSSEEQISPEQEEDSSPQPEPEDINAWAIPASKAKQDWEEQKNTRAEENIHLDDMMNMIGLESMKAKMLEMKTLVDTARRQDVNLSEERFNTILVGNPGTGKSTFARMLAGFLKSLGLVNDKFVTTTGSKLVSDGVSEVKHIIRFDLSYEKGVILIDDAHNLRPDENSTGREVLDFIVSEMDRLQGQVIFIFAGYRNGMDTLLGHNQSLQSRTPFTINFDCYENVELLQILEKQINDKFNGNMKVDKGRRGVYMRMAARRIGRGRGAPSFGNAREVENTLLRMLFRQAARLEEARKTDPKADDLFLTMEDVVGPPPSTALDNSKAWRSLQEMVGLKSVKDSLEALVHRLQVNYDREIAEKPIVECSLNRVFFGNPGTGKTTVAKYYGQIMVDIGLLSDGEVIVKNPADFIGKHLGHSEDITKRIMASTRGKVLIIDEAYALSDKSDVTNDRSSGNSFKTAVVDTMVAHIQGTANEDRCVLLLGYKDRMERMFQHVNPGLSRRFPMSSAFEFEDFSDEELRQILDWKLKEQSFTTTDEAKQVAMEMLSRARNHLNFGNAGEIDILLSKAKELQQIRISKRTDEYDPFLLESQDFDSDFDRPNHAESRIQNLFKDFVGADDIIEKLLGYSRLVRNTKALDIDPRMQIPFNYLFRGPPGTGKTTTARRLGQVFYDMGLLATNEVYDCSATDLIGEYHGHSGPKTQKLFQRALGKVLLIDEAYRLNDKSFGKESLIEMLNILTKEAYKNKLVTILAGYNDDINNLLKVNSGLGSRFPEVIQFENMKPNQCVELFIQRLEEQKLDTTAVKPDRVVDRLRGSFERLATLPDWGNARDVDVLAKSVFGRVLKHSTSEKPTLVVREDVLDAEVAAMITEREKRAGNSCAAVTHV